jgi:hypothetical protein
MHFWKRESRILASLREDHRTLNFKYEFEMQNEFEILSAHDNITCILGY